MAVVRRTRLSAGLPAGRAAGLAAGVLLGLLCGPAAAAEAAAPAERTVTLRGSYQLLVADPIPGFRGSNGHRHRSELRVGGTTYLLRLPAGARQLRGGTGLEVTGTLSGRTLTATSVAPIAGLGEPRVPTTGTARVLVILAEWHGRGQDTTTQASARQQMFTTTSNWYAGTSYGTTTQVGDVTPWVHIAGPANEKCYADSDAIQSQAEAAARLHYNPAAYDRVVIYFPYNTAAGSDCVGIAGWAYQPGSVVWLNGYMDTRVTVHEQGHNYGLAHAHSYRCSTGVLAGSCTFSDYGDDYDAMGASNLSAQFSAKQKNQLGWLPATTLAPGSSVTLAPLERSTGARGAVVHASASRDYWLEYRQRLGEDAGLPNGATNGVLVHAVDLAISPGDRGGAVGPALLDASPADHSLTDATLKAGQGWVTPEGLRLSVGALSPTGASVSVTSARPAVADFTGDGRSDAAVYRPSSTTWFVKGGVTAAYGAAGDVPVPADYNADRRTDIAVWRPSTGAWWVSGSAPVTWGRSGDIPVPGDYNGDGRSDLAVYRPSNTTWYVKGGVTPAYGAAGDVPVPADYNADGRTDVAVWRPSTGAWWVSGSAPVTWGQPGDLAVPGDYNGDRRSDFAVWRPPAGSGPGTWFARGLAAAPFGQRGEVPHPGDFTGDGRSDPAVWSPTSGTWTIQGVPAFSWGLSGDIPVLLPPSVRMTQLGSR